MVNVNRNILKDFPVIAILFNESVYIDEFLMGQGSPSETSRRKWFGATLKNKNT
jgi:hypothetical protein